MRRLTDGGATVRVVSAAITLVALVVSFTAIKAAPDFESAAKQLTILWVVVLSAIWLLDSTSAGDGAINITATILVSLAVLSTAFFIETSLGETGLTWTAVTIGGLFLIVVTRQVLVTILGISMGTITLLAALLVGGLYYLSGR
jgi:hypothetical protein